MTTSKLPSAEELLYELSQITDVPDGDRFRAIVINQHIRAVLEAAAKAVEKHISVDSGDPARWTDSVIVPLVAEIRAFKDDL